MRVWEGGEGPRSYGSRSLREGVVELDPPTTLRPRRSSKTWVGPGGRPSCLVSQLTLYCVILPFLLGTDAPLPHLPPHTHQASWGLGAHGPSAPAMEFSRPELTSSCAPGAAVVQATPAGLPVVLGGGLGWGPCGPRRTTSQIQVTKADTSVYTSGVLGSPHQRPEKETRPWARFLQTRGPPESAWRWRQR